MKSDFDRMREDPDIPRDRQGWPVQRTPRQFNTQKKWDPVEIAIILVIVIILIAGLKFIGHATSTLRSSPDRQDQHLSR